MSHAAKLSTPAEYRSAQGRLNELEPHLASLDQAVRKLANNCDVLYGMANTMEARLARCIHDAAKSAALPTTLLGRLKWVLRG